MHVAKLFMSLVMISFTVHMPWASGAETLHFQAIPTSSVAYVYHPSPEGPGENCAPSRYVCEFGVAGSFAYTWDRNTGIARLTNVNLQLLGSEGDKLSEMATSVGVSDWLENRTFIDQHVLGPYTQFADQTYTQLFLVDASNGYLDLAGGFDQTPADGIGVDFHFRAIQVPEPTGPVSLLVALLLIALCRCECPLHTV